MSGARPVALHRNREPHANRVAVGWSVAVVLPGLMAMWMPGLAAAGGVGAGSATLAGSPAGGNGLSNGAAMVPVERRGEHRNELRRQTLEMHRSWRDSPLLGAPALRGSVAAPAAAAPRPARPAGHEVIDASRTTPIHPLNEPQDGDPAGSRLTESERDLLRRQLRQRARTPAE